MTFSTSSAVSCSSSISPNISSIRSSMVSMPPVPPNSSTTMATLFFSLMNWPKSLLAGIVSGTMIIGVRMDLMDLGFLKNSLELIYQTILSIEFLKIKILE